MVRLGCFGHACMIGSLHLGDYGDRDVAETQCVASVRRGNLMSDDRCFSNGVTLGVVAISYNEEVDMPLRVTIK